jgi:hypothetical protein
MSAVVSASRAKSTWLTGAAGLMLLVAAFVMMVCAAPRTQPAGRGSLTPEQLASWVWSTQEGWVWDTPHPDHGFTTASRGPVP